MDFPVPLTGSADIGIFGLGVMGTSLARNFARHGYAVAAYNIERSAVESLVEHNTSSAEGEFIPANSVTEFVQSLRTPRIAVLMVTAGAATESVIEQLTALLEPGDLIVDCGNSNFKDTNRRENALREQGLHFVGVGVSGGQEGALWGPSIMPGGSEAAYTRLGPLLESIAARAADGAPCCTHVGPAGAGHFVKTVHNGIEYADMQLIAEAYQLLHTGLGLSPAQVAEIFSEWNQGELNSYLLECSAQVLQQVDSLTGQPFVSIISDEAGQKGTGRWTVESALENAVPVNIIAEATFSRLISTRKQQREAVQNAYPAQIELLDSAKSAFIAEIKQALYAGKIMAYSQGFAQITLVSKQYDWQINPAAIARIWRAGCIIRARFLDMVAAAYEADPELPILMAAPQFVSAIGSAETAWRNVVATAVKAGIAVPALSAALSYFDELRTPQLPTALIQGQRDFFGAHSYQRRDRAGRFHTQWDVAGRPEIEI